MKHTVFSSVSDTNSTTHVIPFFKDQLISEEGVLLRSYSPEIQAYIQKVVTVSSGVLGSCEKIILPGDDNRTVLLLGLGVQDQYNERKYIKAARAMIQMLRKCRFDSFVIEPALIMPSDIESSHMTQTLATNLEMANYEFIMYKEPPKDGWHFVQECQYIVDVSNKEEVDTAIQAGAIVGNYISHARDFSNTPGGDMTPTLLANNARTMAEEVGVQCSVLGEKEMASLGMGGILGVSRGSLQEAKLIVLEYKGGESTQKPLAFLGKGITFDSGGLDLKPSGAMNEMHLDMTGAASVIAAVCAIAKLGLKVNIIAVCPAVENMPSGESYRPGDLLKSMSGKTIEVVSPDAEGRIVLADSLTYVQTNYDPELVVDLATLTGASLITLGTRASVILSPCDTFAQELCAIGEKSGDYMWPLPMWEEYEEDIRGVFGDVLNAPRQKSYAGTINGGMFLYQFAKSFKKWAHIDIAPTMTTTDGQYLSKGASGTGVRFLVELARSMSI